MPVFAKADNSQDILLGVAVVGRSDLAGSVYNPGAGWTAVAGSGYFAALDARGQNPASVLASSQVSATTAADGTRVAAANSVRRSLTLVNHNGVAAYVGPSGVSSANGVLLPGVAGAALTLLGTAEVRVIAASGTAVIGVLEERD